MLLAYLIQACTRQRRRSQEILPSHVIGVIAMWHCYGELC